MKILDKNTMKHLSFPDFDIEKFEFNLAEKKLTIFVEGAWLDIDGGFQLGKGALYFKEWESISINRFDPYIEKWSNVDILTTETLKDLCEIRIINSAVHLYGFGKKIGHWMEWRIQNGKMYAEFDS